MSGAVARAGRHILCSGKDGSKMPEGGLLLAGV